MSSDIEIIPIGGYTDFGRNMTAVRVCREIVIFDMGVKLDPLQSLPEGQGMEDLSVAKLREIEAIPDDRILEQVDGEVVAIVISHAHADHVSAVAKLAGRYKDAPIIGSPYTIRFVEDLCEPRDARQHGRGAKRTRGKAKLTIPNELVTLTGRDQRTIGSGKLSVELVHITHSIVGSTLPVLHTPKGAIVYGLDYKLDDTPVLGPKPDYKRLAEIGRQGVHVLITESTNAANDVKTDSEYIARLRLKDLLFGVDHEHESLFVSTFSSNAARIHSIIEYAEDLDRSVFILGRSLDRYQRVAADVGALHIPESVHIAGNGRAAQEALLKIAKEPERHLVVLTGHQGEPGALLTRMAAGETPYKFTKRDDVIFSSNVIPTETCINQRKDLEGKLRKQNVRIFKGAHASGHGSAVEHREMLLLLNPEHIIPAHGGAILQSAYADLASAEGWKVGRDVHVLRNGQRFVVGKDKSPEPRQVDALAAAEAAAPARPAAVRPPASSTTKKSGSGRRRSRKSAKPSSS